MSLPRLKGVFIDAFVEGVEETLLATKEKEFIGLTNFLQRLLLITKYQFQLDQPL